MGTGTVIVLCVICFLVGAFSGMLLIAYWMEKDNENNIPEGD